MSNEAQLARVVAQYRDQYRVSSGSSELWAKVTGKMIFTAAAKADYPVVGDLVEINELDKDHAVILAIRPRKTLLQRKAPGKSELQPIAANLDVAFVVQAVDRDFNLNRLDRYLTIVRAGLIEPVIVLNKIDLIPETDLQEKLAQLAKRFQGVAVLTTSAAAREGTKTLREALKEAKVYCFVGSSGVGKSSIINRLLGKELLKTKEISTFTNKGKHTTTHRQLFILDNGAMVIDNPGMREIGMADSGAVLAEVFTDIAKLAGECRFADCTHDHEPGCAVLKALALGQIDNDQYLNYLKLKKEADHYNLSSLDKKRKERDLSRLVKNYHKQVKPKQ